MGVFYITMKILILEDNESRIKLFKDKLGHAELELYVAETADKAIDMIDNNKFEVVFLDHDLGGKVYVDSGEHNTGHTVAKHVAELELSMPVIIHSFNTVGATNMYKYLTEHGHKGTVVYFPFGCENFLQVLKEICEQCENTA